jgi:ribonuclease VapC
MVIDTSALVAIFLNEPEREVFMNLILLDTKRLFSAVSLVEAAIVLETRQGETVSRELDLFLHEAGIEIVSVDSAQAEQARLAYRRYGKGRHRANLNLGDCFTHALAVVSGEPVLAKGPEFQLANLSTCR